MAYNPQQSVAEWANQNLFGGYLTPKTTAPAAAATAATPSTGYAVPGGPEFKTPTAAEIAANQNTYSNAALGNYQGLPIIQQQLTGQLPRDVQANINQMGAERGIATGSPGSAATNAATLRALGLTSMGLQQQGLQNLNAAYNTFPQLNPLGISGENLAAWRTASDYQTHALGYNAQVELQRELANIASNTRLTEQQRQMAMEQAKNKAYASALQDYLNQTGTTSTASSPSTGTMSSAANFDPNDPFAGTWVDPRTYIAQGASPEAAQAAADWEVINGEVPRTAYGWTPEMQAYMGGDWEGY